MNMTSPVTIRTALASEAAQLSELAFRSKAYWGYDDAFMNACRAELTVTEDSMRRPGVEYAVASLDDAVVGFYALEPTSNESFELEALFVEPDRVGAGIGRQLIQHAIDRVKRKGGRTLTIQGDPNATAFYTSAGATQIGVRESGSIPGRVLPLFEISISAAEAVHPPA